MERCIDANGNHSIPYGGIGFLEACKDDEAGIVDESVEPTETINGKSDDVPAGGSIF